MGVVFEARQLHPDRRVAIKLLRAGWSLDDYGARLFEREVTALARLQHPAIATVYGAGQTEEGDPYLVMELVRGARLDSWSEALPYGPEGLEHKLDRFLAICRAVHYAHQRGVIHRDLKPANVLVPDDTGSEGSTATAPVKVLDFGLARLTDTETVVGQEGFLRGTLPYMSPEQVDDGSDEVDVRSDVNSLGVILYELLTGQRPHDAPGSTPAATLYRILAETPPSAAEVWKERGFRLSRDLDTIVLEALAKEKDERYESAAALADDVERYRSNRPVDARPPSALYHLGKLVARHRLASGLIIALVGAISGFGIYAGIQSRRLAAEVRATQRVVDYVTGLFQLSAALPGVELSEDGDGSSLSAREILDLGAEQVRELEEDPVVRVRLLAALADAYANLGDHDEAARMLEDATSIQVGEGSARVEVARAMNDRALLEVRGSNYEQAEALYERALEIFRGSETSESEDVDRVLTNLGDLYRRTAQLERAEATLTEALARLEARLGTDHPELAFTLSALAATYLTQGRTQEGREAARRALGIRERERPGDVRNEGLREMIGSSYLLEGRFAEADSIYQTVLAARLASGEAERIALSRLNLGELHLRQGKLEASQEQLDAALSLQVAEFGPDHENVAAVLLHLGQLRHQQGEHEEAERTLTRALDIFERDLGPEHPMVGETLAVHAEVLRDTGRPLRADSLLARAEAIWAARGRGLMR